MPVVNLDFGMDYAKSATQAWNNKDYFRAAVYELDVAVEMVIDFAAAYVAAEGVGAVIEGAGAAATGESAAAGKAAAEKFCLSENNKKHILGKHTLKGLKSQASHLPPDKLASRINNKTIFNPKWSEKTVLKAAKKGAEAALKDGIKDGSYEFKYLGETIEIYMQDGKLQTAYGTYKVNEEMLK